MAPPLGSGIRGHADQNAPLDRGDAVNAADRLAERNVDEDWLDCFYSHDVASMALPPARVKGRLTYPSTQVQSQEVLPWAHRWT